MAGTKKTIKSPVKKVEVKTGTVKEAVPEAKESWDAEKLYTLKHRHIRIGKILEAGKPLKLTAEEYKALKGDIEC